MTDFNTLARPYAEAVFQMAQADGNQHDWAVALEQLAAWVDDGDARRFLADPERSQEQKVTLLAGIPVPVAADAWQRLVTLLVANHRWRVAAEIAALYEVTWRAAQHQLEVEVVSAVELSDDQRGAVKAALERRHPGHQVALRESIDPDILGGLLIRAGDESIDASVRGQLDQLAQTLRN